MRKSHDTQAVLTKPLPLRSVQGTAGLPHNSFFLFSIHKTGLWEENWSEGSGKWSHWKELVGVTFCALGKGVSVLFKCWLLCSGRQLSADQNLVMLFHVLLSVPLSPSDWFNKKLMSYSKGGKNRGTSSRDRNSGKKSGVGEVTTPDTDEEAGTGTRDWDVTSHVAELRIE